jgi:hypothetical protein
MSTTSLGLHANMRSRHEMQTKIIYKRIPRISFVCLNIFRNFE